MRGSSSVVKFLAAEVQSCGVVKTVDGIVQFAGVCDCVLLGL